MARIHPADKPLPRNPVVETYSRLALEYDSAPNRASCWGSVSREVVSQLAIEATHGTVADVGCGTGRELAQLAAASAATVEFIGVEPAPKMREVAAARTAEHPNVRILPGSFEELPLEDDSVDYLYSILAFHWTTDLERAVSEIRRVLRAGAEMDLFFIGRENGKEFIRATTPIFFRYLSPATMLKAAGLRKQLTLAQASELFQGAFPGPDLTVDESFVTHYDTLDGHWGWWVRIEGQFLDVPPATRSECDAAVREALSRLAGERGIPYTVHLLHVGLRGARRE
ncbi:MAG: class I SAM-dependent methyltransferase [Gaiellaceae bacterium]